MKRDDIQREALTRAATGQSLSNYPAIIAGFVAKGIPEAQILPRENVFTFHAWKALGRQVKKGEHGVKVCTFIVCSKEIDGPEGRQTATYRKPHTTTVFHVSQTEPIKGADYATRVRAYEVEGLTTSDAQAVCDAEDQRDGRDRETP